MVFSIPNFCKLLIWHPKIWLLDLVKNSLQSRKNRELTNKATKEPIY